MKFVIIEDLDLEIGVDGTLPGTCKMELSDDWA